MTGRSSRRGRERIWTTTPSTIFASSEVCEKWKVYSLVVLVAALYAVSYGFSAKICLGGNEFSLSPKE